MCADRIPDTSRLYWLKDAWNKQALRIDALSRRMADLRHNNGVSPQFFTKFTRMLDQVTFMRNKEREIISEIDAIEKQHRFMRQNKLLRTTENKPLPVLDNSLDQTPEPKKKSNLLFAFLLGLIMAKSNAPANTPQPKN